MKIEVTNTSANPLPCYATPGDAGMDLRASHDDQIWPGNRALIRTGVSVAIPTGCVGLIWPRSGLAIKKGLDTLAGVIDSSYRGEIGVVLINHGSTPVEIDAGDRIAQLLIQPVMQVELVQVESLDGTPRGAGGFGHTGT